MSFFTSSSDALPPPTLQGGILPSDPVGTATFTVGPWASFSAGDTVQLLGGFGNKVLGTTVVPARKSMLGSTTNVVTVDVPVPASTLRTLGTSSCNVKARWVHKDGAAFGSKVSADSTVQFRSNS